MVASWMPSKPPSRGHDRRYNRDIIKTLSTHVYCTGIINEECVLTGWTLIQGDLDEVWVHAQKRQNGMKELNRMKIIMSGEVIEYESGCGDVNQEPG
jgi:hypothetical protein